MVEFIKEKTSTNPDTIWYIVNNSDNHETVTTSRMQDVFGLFAKKEWQVKTKYFLFEHENYNDACNTLVELVKN